MASLPQSLATAQQITTQVGSMIPLGQISSVVQTLSNIQGFNAGAFTQLAGTIQSALQGFDQASSLVQGFASGSPTQAFTDALSSTGMAGSSISGLAETAGVAYRQADSFLSNLQSTQNFGMYSNRPSVEQAREDNNVGGVYQFPRDIGKYWISLQFESATFNAIMGSQQGVYQRKNTGNVILPVPVQLQDVNQLQYQPIEITTELMKAGGGIAGSVNDALSGALNKGSVLSKFMSVLGVTATAVGDLGDTAGSLGGFAVNTHQTLKFRQPTLKTHSFSWKLVPSSQEESVDLYNIIRFIKGRIYPRKAGGELVFKYPDLVNVYLFNADQMYHFKPAYVQSFSVSYTPEGGPAFHKDRYPAGVQIDMTIQENAVWTADDYNVGGLRSEDNGRWLPTGEEIFNAVKPILNI